MDLGGVELGTVVVLEVNRDVVESESGEKARMLGANKVSSSTSFGENALPSGALRAKEDA